MREARLARLDFIAGSCLNRNLNRDDVRESRWNDDDLEAVGKNFFGGLEGKYVTGGRCILCVLCRRLPGRDNEGESENERRKALHIRVSLLGEKAGVGVAVGYFHILPAK